MSDNVQLDAGSGGETIKTVQKSGAHVSVSAIDVGNHDTDSVALIGNAGVYMPVTGAVADNTATSNNPVLVGAKYLATGTSVDDGDAAHLLTDSYRQLRTVLFSKDSNQEFSFHTADFDTDNVNPSADVDFTSCIGIAVPASGGAAAVKSTSIQNEVASVPADPVVGLNTSQIGSFFFDGHTGGSDTTNVAAFGIAIASGTGPKAVGSDGATTTYLPVSVGNEVSIASGELFVARTNITDDSTKTALKADTDGHLQVDLASNPTVSIDSSNNAVSLGTDLVHIAGRTTIATPSTATSLLVDAAGHLQVDVLSSDAAGYSSNFDNAGGQTVNANSYGIVVPGASGPVVVEGDANGLNTKSMAVVQGNISSNSFSDSDAKQLRVDATGALHVTGGGGTSEHVYTANDAISTPDSSAKVSMSGAVVDNSLSSATPAYTDGDAAPLKVTQVGALHVKPQQDPDGALGNVGIVGRNDIGLASQMDIDVDENKANLVAGDVTIYGISAFNSTDSPIYLKFWDQGVSTVTVGSTTPKLTFLIPANAVSNGAGFVLNVPQGIFFDYQVVWAATTGVDETSSSGPPTNGCILNFFYKA